MKTKISIIVFILFFASSFVNKSFGQGWERTIENTDWLTDYYKEEDFFPLSDGGLITTDYSYRYRNASNNNNWLRSLFLNRFDKYGNLIWNQRHFYNFNSCDFIDPDGNIINCNYDTLEAAKIFQVLQLPNHDIVLMHDARSEFLDGRLMNNLKCFTIIDNYGNVKKRVFNNNDTIVRSGFIPGNSSERNIEKMFYNSTNNTIECIYFRPIGRDSILFVKMTYDENLVKISTYEKLTIKNNINANPSGNIDSYLSFIRTEKDNYYWYDGQTNSRNIGYTNPSRIMKFDKLGNLIYDFNSDEITLKNAITASFTANYINIEINDASSNIDILENDQNEVMFGINVNCYFNEQSNSSLYLFKSKHAIYTLDSLGLIKNIKIIESINDTISAVSINRTPSLYLKQINNDTILILAVRNGDANNITQSGKSWEAIKLNFKVNQIISQYFINPLGYNNAYQAFDADLPIKKYSNENKYMYY